jgi:predicted Rossmann fold flavoprotein
MVTSALLYDLAIIGGGAAGLMCASVAGQRGLRVLLIDHSDRRAEKIRISGGGRCNFTNLEGDRLERFSGADPRFARFALRAYPPARFIDLVRAHRIRFHEKHKGQLFCDDSSEQIIDLLAAECAAGQVDERRPCVLSALRHHQSAGAHRFELDTDLGVFAARSVAVATGGLSIPKIGATDLGYRLARQFGHRIVEPRPALVPLVFDPAGWADLVPLAGVACPVHIRSGDSPTFDEDLLFTHRGLSGPAVLQASTFWRPDTPLSIDLFAGTDPNQWLAEERDRSGRLPLASVLAHRLPRRLASLWSERVLGSELAHRKFAELGRRDLARLTAQLANWSPQPTGTEGHRKAEVTSGGIATDEIDPRTMESRRVPGLHFIGEVVDITGWLGGYNFQWAWASAYVAGHALAR